MKGPLITADIIDGKRYAEDLARAVSDEVAGLISEGVRPALATVLAGDSYPARAYERRVRQLAERIEVPYRCEHLPGDVEEADLLATLGKLGADPRISGILVLRPLPDHVSESSVYRALEPLKDIEAVHPVNAGLLALGRPRFVPSTPASAFHLLDRYLHEQGHDPTAVYASSSMVIIGRSNNVGKPAILLAQARNATITSCDVHSYKAGLLYEHTRAADILIVAAGVPGLIQGDHVKDGALVVDIGINPVEEPETGRTVLVGDVDRPSVVQRAAAVSPVPGGVGPITDVWLLHNVAVAARLAAGIAAAQPSLEGIKLLPQDVDGGRPG